MLGEVVALHGYISEQLESSTLILAKDFASEDICDPKIVEHRQTSADVKNWKEYFLQKISGGATAFLACRLASRMLVNLQDRNDFVHAVYLETPSEIANGATGKLAVAWRLGRSQKPRTGRELQAIRNEAERIACELRDLNQKVVNWKLGLDSLD